MINGQAATGDFAWNPQNFAGFYYDIDDDVGNEMLIATLSDGMLSGSYPYGLSYQTTAQEEPFSFKNWGSFSAIGFLGKKCFAGYQESTDPDRNLFFQKSKDGNALAKGQLEEVLLDDDAETVITTNNPLKLKEGYKLELKALNASDGRIYVELTKEGQVVHSKMFQLKENAALADKTYFYKKDVGAQNGLVVIAVHFKNAFHASDQDLATIDGIFQISDSPMLVTEGTSFGKMRISAKTSDQIFMDNQGSPITLSKNKDVLLAWPSLYLRTADQSVVDDMTPLRYYPYRRIDSPGKYDIRGAVSTGDYVWTPQNFAGFYYDLDDDAGTETIKATLSDNKLAGDYPYGLVYTTAAQEKPFQFQDWGSYYVMGFLGEKCFAGYIEGSGSEKGYLFEKSADRSALDKAQLLKILADDDTERIITSNNSLKLGEGYELDLKSIDIDGNKAYIELSRNGTVVDYKELQPSKDAATMADETYYYSNPQVGDQKSLVTIAVHFKNAFRGADQNIATIDGVWQISDAPFEVKPDIEYGKMTIETVDVTNGVIAMDNKDYPVILSKNKDTLLMGGIYLQTADSDSLRYYIVKHEQIKDRTIDEEEADHKPAPLQENAAMSSMIPENKEPPLAGGSVDPINPVSASIDQRTTMDLSGSSQEYGGKRELVEEQESNADEVDQLIRDLQDPDSEVRKEAASALGSLGDIKAVDSLISALADENPEVRMIAAGSLGQLGDVRAAEPLIESLDDMDGDVRSSVAMSLGWLGHARAVQPLIKALNDQDILVRSSASDSLGQIGDAKAVEPLIQSLSDECVVRISAAGALGPLGDARAVEPLIQAMNEDDCLGEVRESAAFSLGLLGDARALEPLIQALNDRSSLSSGVYVRRAAAYSLGKLGDPLAIEPLIKALNDEDREVVLWAYYSLAKLGKTEYVDSLLVYLTNKEDSLRGKAAEALGDLEESRAVEPLIRLLNDEDSSVRLKAAEALGNIGDARARDPLDFAQDDEDSNVRKAVAAALEKLNPAEDENDGIDGTAAPADARQVGADRVLVPAQELLIQTSEWGKVPANQVLIVLKDGKGRSDADRIAASLGGQIVGNFGYINLYQIKISTNTEGELKSAIEQASKDPDVELAFPNQQAIDDMTIQGVACSPLDDPVYTEKGRGKGYEMIGVQNAWDLIRASGLSLSKVNVGVVDDGLYKGNDEFNGKTKIDTNVPDSELTNPNDQFGSHGTRIMNILAANSDNGGVTGIASEPLKDKLTVSMINRWAYGANAMGSLLAVNESINNGAKIVSCSWGDTHADPNTAKAYKNFFEKMARDHPDVLFVCSAGNDGEVVDGTRRYPSGLNLPNMITVGNVMNDGTRAAGQRDENGLVTSKSNMASNDFEVTLAAPGEQAVKGFDNQGHIINDNGGTSMATPQVTAAAAMIRALNPRLDAGKIKEILTRSARTSVDIDGQKMPAPRELGGKILAIDQAVLEVIRNLKPEFKDLTMEQILAFARVGLLAKNDSASPQDWKVTAEILGVRASGADAIIELQGEGAVGGDSKRQLSQSGSLDWDVTIKDSSTVVVQRLDTKGCSRVLLPMPAQGLSGKWKIWEIVPGTNTKIQGVGGFTKFIYELSQSGNDVTFTAPAMFRSQDIKGTISGDTFTGTIIDNNPKSSNYGRTQGRVEVVFSTDGNHFTGRMIQEGWGSEMEWGGDKVS